MSEENTQNTGWLIKAIVYTTNTGSTKEYARILADQTGFSSHDARSDRPYG
ncbi:MAG: hypothetical protein GX567_07195 [Clostridia bacterium]|nr:hypothetical protein [Clostridia bacterium]